MKARDGDGLAFWGLFFHTWREDVRVRTMLLEIG